MSPAPMSPAVPIAIVVGVFCLILGIGYLMHLAARKRAEARRAMLTAWAARGGWSYDPTAHEHYDETFKRFSLFRHGFDRYASNVMTGWIGPYQMLLFDYQWSEKHGTGDSETTVTYYRSVTMLRSPFRTAPFVLRPERMTDRLAEFFGYEDIDFEHAEFSRAFHLSSPERRRAFDVFHPRAIEHVMASRIPSLECDGNWMIVHSHDRGLLDPRAWDWYIGFLKAMLDLTPSHLRSDPGALNTGAAKA